jgi:hypothetical protein
VKKQEIRGEKTGRKWVKERLSAIHKLNHIYSEGYRNSFAIKPKKIPGVFRDQIPVASKSYYWRQVFSKTFNIFSLSFPIISFSFALITYPSLYKLYSLLLRNDFAKKGSYVLTSRKLAIIKGNNSYSCH